MSINYKNNFQILLIGNLGQLGSEIEKTLIIKRYKYQAINRNQLDLTNFEALLSFLNKIKFNLIINCAAFTNVDLAEKEKILAYKLNADLPKILAIHCKKKNIRLIHFSTDFVFDGLANTPYVELDKLKPVNFYGYTKLKGEENILSSLDNFLIFRVSSVFGNSKNNFIYKIIKKLKTEKSFKIVDDQISTPTSSNFISNLMVLILDLLITKRIDYGVYHAVPRGSISKYQLAMHVKNLLKINKIKLINKELIPISSENLSHIAKRPNYSVLNSNLLESKIKINFEDWSYYGNVKIMEIFNENN